MTDDITQNDWIPNFSFFEAAHVQIQIFESEDEDEYKSGVLFFIDDGINEKQDYNVTLLADLVHTDKVQLSKIVFLYVSTIFSNIDPKVKVWSSDMSTYEELDLRSQEMKPSGYTLQ